MLKQTFIETIVLVINFLGMYFHLLFYNHGGFHFHLLKTVHEFVTDIELQTVIWHTSFYFSVKLLSNVLVMKIFFKSIN